MEDDDYHDRRWTPSDGNTSHELNKNTILLDQFQNPIEKLHKEAKLIRPGIMLYTNHYDRGYMCTNESITSSTSTS